MRAKVVIEIHLYVLAHGQEEADVSEEIAGPVLVLCNITSRLASVTSKIGEEHRCYWKSLLGLYSS